MSHPLAWHEQRENESLQGWDSRRLMECPVLSGAEMEVLRQCRMTIWDGNVASKSARDSLMKRGLITRFSGWQVITREGMAVLHTLGEMNDDRWPKRTDPKTERK